MGKRAFERSEKPAIDKMEKVWYNIYRKIERGMAMENWVKVTDYWFVVRKEDGEYIKYCDNEDQLLKEASKVIAFNDMEVIHVRSEGRAWHYNGWAPGMLFEWVRDDGDRWMEWFEEWDH